MKLWRMLVLRFALAERRQVLARRGYSVWCAYILCGDSFKPGAKARLENEMRVLYERVDRIKRGWWRWR